MSFPHNISPSAIANLTSALNQVFDPAAIGYDAVGNPYATGMWRGLQPSDFTNVTISGASVSINAIAITGNPNVSIANTPSVLNVGGYLGITGTPTVSATINSGSFTPTFSVITSSQVQIPVGVRQWSVSVVSGGAYMNGSGPILPAHGIVRGGGYDGRWILAAAINVGITGGNALVSYES